MPKPVQKARVQLSKQEFNDLTARKETPGTIFNIWHLQESGGDIKKTLSGNRLSPCRWSAKDIGTTAAPEDHERFCIWFCRGMCIYGPECRNFHRIPGKKDAEALNPALDCFGREKHAAYRDDRAGVGSFMHENRSIRISNFDPAIKNLEQVIKNRFAPFGNIESVQVGSTGRDAIVTYRFEAQAQFAKEAMSFQPLVKQSRRGIIVRWA